MSILTHYIPIIYPSFWNARHERPHGPSLAPHGRERRHQHCGARTSQRGARRGCGRVMDDLTRKKWDFSASTRGFYLQLIIQRCMNQKIVCQIRVKAFDCGWIIEPRPGYRNVSKPTPYC